MTKAKSSLLKSPMPGLNDARRQFRTFPWATRKYCHPLCKKPLISIVLPVFNQGETLEDSVNSVLQEDFYEVELVVVDDGSTDSTPEVLERFSGDSRILVIRQGNQGLSAALNRGFSETTGEFLSWTSGDNLYERGALAGMADFLLANPEVGLVYANVRLIDSAGKPYENSTYRQLNHSAKDSSLLMLPTTADTLALFPDNFVNACFMYRRKLRDLIGAYDTNLPGLEDYDFWMKIQLFSTIAHVDDDEIYYRYRLHEGSLTAQINSQKLAEKTKTLARASRARLESKKRRWRVDMLCDNRDESLGSLLGAALLEAGQNVNPIRAGAWLPTDAWLPADMDSPTDTGPARYRLALLRFESPPDRTQSSHRRTSGSANVRIGRPTSFPSGLDYLHTSHKECHGDFPVLPFAATTVKTDRETECETESSFLALPPLCMPKTLLRARDSDFGAVTPHRPSAPRVLIFTPDWRGEPDLDQGKKASALTPYDWTLRMLLKCASNLQKTTLVLLSRNSNQRKTADWIFLHLGGNTDSNLRILDIGPESTSRSDDDFGMMYALGSTDAILSLKGPSWNSSSALELRAEAAWGAIAGKGILLLAQEPIPRTRLSATSLFSDRSEPLIHDLATALIGSKLVIPHLRRLGQEWKSSENPSTSDLYEELQGELEQGLQIPDFSSLEQWLCENGIKKLGETLLAMAISSASTSS